MAKAVLNRIAGALRDRGPKDRAHPSDSELLDRFRRDRDEEAFAALVNRHGKAVLAACRHVLSNPSDVDDVFQATFLILCRKIATIDSGTVGSWLYAVAHRTAVRARSDARRRAEREGTAASRRQVEVLPPDLSWSEAVAILHEELDRLPNAYRRVLLLCYLRGWSREETAAALGSSLGAVQGRLQRGRKMLAARLARRGIAVSVGLLAVVTGNSAGSDRPAPRLIDLTVRAVNGATSPTVTALARGVPSMTSVVKKTFVCMTALAGLALLTGLGLAVSRPDTPPPVAAGPQGDEPPAPKQENTPASAKPIVGLVKDSAGAPLAGATVLAVGDGGDGERLSTVSDAEGKFRFDPPPRQKSSTARVFVVAVHDRFAPVTSHYSRLDDFVMPEAGRYGGTVKDPGGRPVPGAEVQVGFVKRARGGSAWGYMPAAALRGSPAERFYFTKTDAAGRFEFTGLEAGSEVIFRVTAKGFAELDTGAGGASEGAHAVKPNAKPAELVLKAEAVIRGRIVSSVPGVKPDAAEVQVQGTHELHGFWRKVKPDASGQFTADRLPAGTVSVSLVFPAGAPATAAGHSMVTVSGEAKELSLEIIAGVEVSGRVIVRGTGNPLAGVEMMTEGVPNPGCFHFGVKPTDADGRFKLRLPPGKSTLRVWTHPPGYGYSGDREDSLREVEILAGTDRLEVPRPFALVEVLKQLNGQVKDATGKPIPHVKVSPLNHASVCGSFDGESIAASFDGQFTLPYSANGSLEVGRSVPLRVDLSDGRRFEAAALVTKEGIAEVRVPTLPDVAGPTDVKPEDLVGIVVDEKGKPLAGVKVHVWEWVDKPENYTHTGADGVFRMKDCGKDRQVQVRFSKDGYSPVMATHQPVGVNGLVIAMDRSTYFEGVVRGPDGKPVAGAVVRADQGPKMLEGGSCPHMWTEARADGQGRYRLFVQADEYAFHVKAAGVGVARLPKTGIAHGRARPFDIQLEPGVTFRARVVDSVTGRPAAGVRLFNWQQKDIDGRSDENGEISFSEMIPGEFSFNLESDGHARWWSDQAKHAFQQKTAAEPSNKWQRNFDDLAFDLRPGRTVTVVVEPAVRVTGKVLDPNGKPVAGATVAPALTGTGNSLTGDTRFSVETKADGSFVVALPASGAAEYNLIAHDGKYGEWRTWANGVLPPIKTTPGQTIDNVTLKLTRPAVVRGKVVDENGRPVADREVKAQAADGLENRYYDPTTTTREDGTFELKYVRPGEQKIQLGLNWVNGMPLPRGKTQTLKLKEGEVVENVVLVAGEPQSK